MLRDILSEKDAQVQAVERVVRAADADVILLLGVDYDLNGVAIAALADRIGDYPYRFSARPNRGMATGLDLDGDGRLGGPGDAQGYGAFSGKSGMAILSRLPIAEGEVRDFSALPWIDMPDHSAPAGAPPEQRLSTTGHWDVPIDLGGGKRLHLLAWHATPPVFEARNLPRNHDETAFWLRYLDGALPETAPVDFVLLGDANLDPVDGDGRNAAIRALLAHPRVQDLAPNSPQGGQDTAVFERGPGALRVDYVLPSDELTVLDAGVLWPAPETSLGRDVETASRHRLVWVDIDVGQGGGNGDQMVGVAEIGQ